MKTEKRKQEKETSKKSRTLKYFFIVSTHQSFLFWCLSLRTFRKIQVFFENFSNLKIRKIIQRIKHTEDIHPMLHSDLTKLVDDIIRITGVADSVSSSKQHL